MRISKSFYSIVLLASLILTSCFEDESLSEIKGSGNQITESRVVDSFSAIEISSVVNANVVQSNTQALSVTTDDNILPLVKTNVRNGILFVDLEQGSYEDVDVTVSIALPEIEYLTTDGVNTVNMSNINNDNLSITLEGVGDITLSGQTGKLEINSNGSTNLDGFDLISEICDISLSGIGNAEVKVVNELSGTLSGVGNILYKGEPQINVDVTGVGNIVDAN